MRKDRAISRRPFLQSVIAGAAVVGFDPSARSWVTEARASGSLVRLPRLDGTVFTDSTHLDAAADDFGHVVRRQPIAVLFPGSVEDIVKIVRFARDQRLKIAVKGQGHSQFGQAEALGGIVVDSSSLASIHAIGGDRADVDAGVTWGDLVDAVAVHGLTPAVLTDHLGLAVGGTLSVGGLGGTTQHFGLQADNVLELQVVTGEGELVRCSDTVERRLFDAVRAGLGQCAIIVRATVRLVPAKTNALVFHLFYDDVGAYVRDQVELLRDGRFSYLEGQVVARLDGNGWRYMVEAASYFTPPAVPDQAELLAGLSDDRGSAEIFAQSYRDFAFRLVPLIEFLKSIGVWGFPHPWLSLWVPASQAGRYVGTIVSTLTAADTGQGPILFYPIKTGLIDLPLFRLPDEPVAFAFNILKTAAPPTSDVVSAMLANNRELYDQLLRRGGTRYAIGAIPFTRHDWAKHFRDRYGFLVEAKARFDPDNVLAPGQGIFP